VTRYARPERRELPGRKRCKTRHSKQYRVRCRHPRGHEGDCWFGWLGGVNLDALGKIEVFTGPPRIGLPEDFDG